MRTSRIATAAVAAAAAAGLSLALVGPAAAATTEANFAIDIVVDANGITNTVTANGNKLYDAGDIGGGGFDLGKGDINLSLGNFSALFDKLEVDFKGCQLGLAFGDVYKDKSYTLTGGTGKYSGVTGGTGQVSGNLTFEAPYQLGKKGNTPTKTPSQPANCGNGTRLVVHIDLQGTIKGL